MNNDKQFLFKNKGSCSEFISINWIAADQRMESIISDEEATLKINFCLKLDPESVIFSALSPSAAWFICKLKPLLIETTCTSTTCKQCMNWISAQSLLFARKMQLRIMCGMWWRESRLYKLSQRNNICIANMVIIMKFGFKMLESVI